MTDAAGLDASIPRAELHLFSRAEQIMLMVDLGHRRWTTADVERLIEERDGYTPRYELVDGELLVTPAPTLRHQRIVLALATRLRTFLERAGGGEVVIGPAEVHLQTGEHYEPDLFVIPLVEGRRQASAIGASRPLLVCEVLSPSSIRHDRLTKRRAFQRNAVRDYWIVDGGAEVFEIWQLGDERPAIIDDRLEWAPAGATEPFTLDVRAFFASVADGGPFA